MSNLYLIKVYTNALTIREIPTEHETNSKTTLTNLEPFIIERQAPK